MQPPVYLRKHDFTADETLDPTSPLPGSQVDLELNTIKETLDPLLANLALIQRDDGRVQNRTIGLDQLNTEALAAVDALVPTIISEFIFDIAGPGITTLAGTDRNGKTLAYDIGSTITLHEDGLKLDPDTITSVDGINIVVGTPFANPSTVVVEVLEATGSGSVVDTEAIDDISGSFNGVQTVFPITVGGVPRTVDSEQRLDISINDIILEPVVKFTVSGTNITFITAPLGIDNFWGRHRQIIELVAGGIDGSKITPGSIGGTEIGLGEVTEAHLSFNISAVHIGGGTDWYDDVLPASAPAGSVVFPIGQTIGNAGSGASLADDDYEVAFNIFKKRWGNVGTEVFANGDQIMLPDLRGTNLTVPDKGKGKVTSNNTIGSQSGAQSHNIAPSVTGTTIASNTNNKALVAVDLPHHTSLFTNRSVPSEFVKDSDSVSIEALGAGAAPVTFILRTIHGGDVPTNAANSVNHLHPIPALTLSASSSQTGILNLDPYTVVEKIIRIK